MTPLTTHLMSSLPLPVPTLSKKVTLGRLLDLERFSNGLSKVACYKTNISLNVTTTLKKNIVVCGDNN